jgi:hypothetical protein
MSEERRRSHDRRKGLDAAILQELAGRFGIDTTAYLTAALVAEGKAWDFIGGRGGDFRSYLPALLGRGLLASPHVTRELVLLFDGGDTRLLRRCADALAGRSSDEVPVFTPPAPIAPTSLEPISAAAELHARRVDTAAKSKR